MLFPKHRMRFTTVHQGKSDPQGWIVLEISSTDLEGVNKVYLSLDDIQKVKEGGDQAAERLRSARALLGGLAEEEKE